MNALNGFTLFWRYYFFEGKGLVIKIKKNLRFFEFALKMK